MRNQKSTEKKKSTRQEKVAEGGSVYEDTVEETDEGIGGKNKKILSRKKLLDLTFG